MIRNERLKLLANFVNAIGLGLIAIAVLRPIVETGVGNYWLVGGWTLAGLGLHGFAHYILGHLR